MNENKIINVTTTMFIMIFVVVIMSPMFQLLQANTISTAPLIFDYPSSSSSDTTSLLEVVVDEHRKKEINLTCYNECAKGCFKRYMDGECVTDPVGYAFCIELCGVECSYDHKVLESIPRTSTSTTSTTTRTTSFPMLNNCNLDCVNSIDTKVIHNPSGMY